MFLLGILLTSATTFTITRHTLAAVIAGIAVLSTILDTSQSVTMTFLGSVFLVAAIVQITRDDMGTERRNRKVLGTCVTGFALVIAPALSMIPAVTIIAGIGAVIALLTDRYGSVAEEFLSRTCASRA